MFGHDVESNLQIVGRFQSSRRRWRHHASHAAEGPLCLRHFTYVLYREEANNLIVPFAHCKGVRGRSRQVAVHCLRNRGVRQYRVRVALHNVRHRVPFHRVSFTYLANARHRGALEEPPDEDEPHSSKIVLLEHHEYTTGDHKHAYNLSTPRGDPRGICHVTGRTPKYRAKHPPAI